METVLEIVALLIGLAVFVTLATVSLCAAKPRSQSWQDDGFVPGNHHADHDIMDDDHGA